MWLCMNAQIIKFNTFFHVPRTALSCDADIQETKCRTLMTEAFIGVNYLHLRRFSRNSVPLLSKINENGRDISRLTNGFSLPVTKGGKIQRHTGTT